VDVKKIHALALERFKLAEDFERLDRELAVEDLRFAAGGIGQWPVGMDIERQREGRPMITINRLAASIKQVINDARQKRPGIKVIPAGADSPEHEKIAKKKAEIIEGIVRQIEASSRAQNVYLPAYELMVRGGFRGSWEVCTRYCEDEGFEQEIYLSPITSPFAVYRDPDGKQLDRADDKWVFVVEEMTEPAYKAKFPKDEESDWPGGWEITGFGQWNLVNKIRVARHWYIETETRDISVLDNGETVDGSAEAYQYPDDHDKYPGAVHRKMATRKVEKRKVMCVTMNGRKVLDGPHEFPSKYIPVVSVEGPRQWVGDQMQHWSLIRDAKGPQVLYNVSQTNIAERIGLAPKQPFIATAVQVGANAEQWANANRTTDSTLIYTADPMAPGPPQRQQPAPINQAEIMLAAQCIDDIKACMGIFDRSLGNSSSEHSGRAILAVQAQGDNATYDFPDMLATAIGYCGRVLVDMIPRVYNSKRTMRVMNPNNTTVSHVIINSQDMDLTVGRHDVEVTVGPSFQTKRMELRESLIELSQALPQIAQIGGDIIVKAQDFPGADELAERMRKTLPPGLAKPADGEEPESPPPPPPPDPEVMIKMRVAKADVELKEAQAEKVNAETAGVQLANEVLAMQITVNAATHGSGVDAEQMNTIHQLIAQTISDMMPDRPQDLQEDAPQTAQPEQPLMQQMDPMQDPMQQGMPEQMPNVGEAQPAE